MTRWSILERLVQWARSGCDAMVDFGALGEVASVSALFVVPDLLSSSRGYRGRERAAWKAACNLMIRGGKEFSWRCQEFCVNVLPG